MIYCNHKVFQQSNFVDLKFLGEGLSSKVFNLMTGSTLSAMKSKNFIFIEFPIEGVRRTEVHLICESGTISTDLNYTHLGVVTTLRHAWHISARYLRRMTNWDAFLYSIQDCEGKRECVVEFKPYWFFDLKLPVRRYDLRGIVKLYCQGEFKIIKIFRFF